MYNGPNIITCIWTEFFIKVENNSEVRINFQVIDERFPIVTNY